MRYWLTRIYMYIYTNTYDFVCKSTSRILYIYIFSYSAIAKRHITCCSLIFLLQFNLRYPFRFKLFDAISIYKFAYRVVSKRSLDAT